VTSSSARAADELPRPPSPGEPADPHRPRPALFPEPVVVVTLPEKPPAESGRKRWSPWDHDCAALDVFAERLLHAWEVERRPQDSAAVLTASWPKAIAARDRLRAILRGRGNAFLDGSRELAGRPVARDVRTIVRALWDGTDDIAWVGLWRHPMVGLSDGALASFQAGTGLLPAENQARGLSGALHAEALARDVYPAADVAVFQRVRRPLRQARRDIGRLPTAAVVERLAAELRWRAILLAGPDGRDAFAELEVVLDWIRQAEADRVDPDAVVALLDPERGEEAPRVELHRGERAVSCTTIHQAKGLKYHHVHVADIGTSRSGARGETWSRAEVTLDGRARTLLGVRFDPDGALKPRPDLLHHLADCVAAARLDEERLRLAYVAITRAVRSVTFALGGGEGIHARLSELWTAEPDLPGVHRETERPPEAVDAGRAGYAEAVGRFAVAPVEPCGWSIVPPSRAGDGWKLQDEAALAELVAGIAARCTLRAGRSPLDPPAPEGRHGEGEVDDSSWGTLVHGWLEHGGLQPAADVAQAARYLAQVYGSDDPRLADWLVRLVRDRLEPQQPELLATLRGLEPTQLHFELPFAGTSGGPAGAPWFHAGRMDLVVTWPDRRAWVIDFKAGRKSPTSKADVLSAASLPEYGPQLEAYRSALTAAGWTVERVGLLFVRTGAWVEW
jgi:ATP-dependent exoDNAse (exonuclease V) beta subunit